MTGALVGVVAVGLAAGVAVVAVRVVRTAREAATRRSFVLGFPREFDAGSAEALVGALSGLLTSWWRRPLGQPAVVFEVEGAPSGIRHLLHVPAALAGYLPTQLRALGVSAAPLEEAAGGRPSVGVELARRRPGELLRVSDPGAVGRGLLAALQPLGGGEYVVIQCVVTPTVWAPIGPSTLAGSRPGWRELLGGRAGAPARAALPASELRRWQAEPAFLAALRIGADAAKPAAANQLLARVLASFHHARGAGVSLRRRFLPTRLVGARVGRAAVPVLAWPCLLRGSELAALLALPVGGPVLPGLTLGDARQLPPTAAVPRGGLVLGTATFPGMDRAVALPPEGLLRHAHVLGPTGVGKSTLLLGLATQVLAAGRGLVVIEPKGDLIADLLERIPAQRERDVILLDPTDAARPVGFNLLTGAAERPELVADAVVTLFFRLFRAFWGPRTDDLLRAAVLTLVQAAPGATLAEVPLLLTHDAFRRRLTARLDDHVLEGFWGWYEGLSAAQRGEAIGPVLNKLRTFLLRRRLRNVVGQSRATFSLEGVLANRGVLLVNLAKGQLGEDAARLLGAAVLAQLWGAVQARSALEPAARLPVTAVIDEFQDYLALPTSLADVLAQGRGYGLGLVLAHQHLAQLDADTRHAVLANARSRVVFQTLAADAAAIAKELRPHVEATDLQALPAFEAYASVFAAGAVQPPCRIRTFPPPTPVDSAARVRAASRARYGRDVGEVEAAIRARTEGSPRRAPVGRKGAG